MTEIFSGTALVNYSQMYLSSNPLVTPELFEAFSGQANWWCGVAVPGTVFLRFGRQDGLVNIKLEVLEAEPDLQPDTWDEIVEVSYRRVNEQTSLLEWGGDLVAQVDLPYDLYRIRWHGRGMDAATALEGNNPELAVDDYLIQLWAAVDVGELILKTAAT